MSNPDNNNLEREAKKRLALKTGVWIFSLAIFSFWLITLGISFRQSAADNTQEPLITDWQTDLNQTIAVLKDGLDVNLAATNTPLSFNASESRAFLSEMNSNLEEQSLASITPALTATLTPEQVLIDLKQRLPLAPELNCPEYINCMPTIGESRPCVIPPGCEDITQIAY